MSFQMCYCGGTKSCTTLKPWLKPLFVGLCRGNRIILGLLGWCRISSIHTPQVMIPHQTQGHPLLRNWGGLQWISQPFRKGAVQSVFAASACRPEKRSRRCHFQKAPSLWAAGMAINLWRSYLESPSNDPIFKGSWRLQVDTHAGAWSLLLTLKKCRHYQNNRWSWTIFTSGHGDSRYS